MGSNTDLDIISIVGNNEGSKCGYCKNLSNNKSYGIICDNMKPETYFHFMNRGWRRCGTYFYKPLNEITCCPLYTIRCDTRTFELSKSQRKVLKTFRKFLLNGKETLSKKTLEKKINARGDEVSSSEISDNPPKQPATMSNISTKSDKSKKAKTIRYNNKLEKLKRQSNGDDTLLEQLNLNYRTRRLQRLDKNKPKTLSQYLDLSSVLQAKHRLEVRTLRCHPEHREFTDSKAAEHKVYMKYQCSVHGDSPAEVTMKQFERFLVSGGLWPGKSVDKIDLRQPRRGGLPQGQYHQQYWLDGRTLIAVGVVDLAASALSSVYLFYDPDYAFLNLGVFSALCEIDFVHRLALTYDDDEFQYYYMGFYAHACPKMRYKAQYHGSMLLCPVSMSWVPVEACRDILDRIKFDRFAPTTAPADASSLEQRSMSQIAAVMTVVISGRQYKLKRFLAQLGPEYLRLLEEFAKLIGARILPTVRIRI